MQALPAVTLPERAIKVSTGFTHTCSILESGKVYCWGFNGSDQLGRTTDPSLGYSDSPGLVSVLGVGQKGLEIAAGATHTCAILDDGSGIKGSVQCWGSNDNGERGHSTGLVNLGPGRSAIKIRAGLVATCALLDNETLKCWGLNSNGQLGQGHTNSIGLVDTDVETLNPILLGINRFVKGFFD
jgi:alpha-tubulin suppressor-like RCC1 family protein